MGYIDELVKYRNGEPVIWAIVGNSVGQGYTCDGSGYITIPDPVPSGYVNPPDSRIQSYHYQLRAHIKTKNPSSELLNTSISGWTLDNHISNNTISALAARVSPPTLIFLALQLNESGQAWSDDRYLSTLRSIIGSIQSHGISIVLCSENARLDDPSVYPYQDPYQNEVSYRDMRFMGYQSLIAEEYGFSVVDFTAPFAAEFNSVGGRANSTLMHNTYTYPVVLGSHPNQHGHDFMATIIKNYVDYSNISTFTDTIPYLYTGSGMMVGGYGDSLASSVSPPSDTTAPQVTAFVVPGNSASLTVSITTFTATDNTGVTGWMITESATPPAAGAAGWTGSAPSTYTASGPGAVTLYPWAKDAAGNVSVVFGSPQAVSIVLPDTTPPTWPAPNLHGYASGTTIRLTWFSASDNVGVSGYLVKRDGAHLTTAVSPTYLDTGLTAGITYDYTVTPVDAAGNEGPPASISVMCVGNPVVASWGIFSEPELLAMLSSISMGRAVMVNDVDTIPADFRISARNVNIYTGEVECTAPTCRLTSGQISGLSIVHGSKLTYRNIDYYVCGIDEEPSGFAVLALTQEMAP